MNSILITANYNCNLDCMYCYEKNQRSSEIFSIEKAQKLLNDFLNRDIEDKFTVIDFHGGEPFLVFEEIKKLCEWAWSKSFKHKFLFLATSNGTLIHGKIQDWLKSNKDKFSVGLSIDGNKMMHDLNRSNSFDLIDLDFFINTWPDLGVKMTISPLTLPFLSDGIIYLHLRGVKKITSNLAEFIDWQNKSYHNFLQEQLSLLSEFYLHHPDFEPSFLFSDEMLLKVLDTSPIIPKYCGAGTEMKTFDIDGKEYPCHLFFESICGKEKCDDALKINFADPNEYIDPNCTNCVIERFCPTCLGANYYMTNKIGCRNKNTCELNKINAKHSCEFLYSKLIKQLENKPMEEYSEDERYIILQKFNAIKKIVTSLT